MNQIEEIARLHRKGVVSDHFYFTSLKEVDAKNAEEQLDRFHRKGCISNENYFKLKKELFS